MITLMMMMINISYHATRGMHGRAIELRLPVGQWSGYMQLLNKSLVSIPSCNTCAFTRTIILLYFIRFNNIIR